MKKRLFSFLIIVVIAVAALISFGVPTIINNGKVGMEYNGGFDILYEINSDSSEYSKKELSTAASEGIKKRLDISNVLDPIVDVEGDSHVRVTVSASNQIVADDIRKIIESGSDITFRDTKNNLKATGEEILEEVGASLSSETNQYGYPVILLHIANTEKLAEITGEIKSLENGENKLVVWLGYEEGDDYANLSTDASIAKKIIYNATVTTELDTDTIEISGAYSKSVAQSTVDLINSGTMDYELDVLQITSVRSTDAKATFNKVLIAGLVAILLVVVALCVYYKLGGLVSSIALIFNTFISVLLFVWVNGAINQQFMAAIIVALGLTIDAIVIVLERVKNEMYNGKNLQRALKEGFRKSYPSIVDANVVAFLLAVTMFFLGNSVSNFAIMLAISSASTLFVMTLVYKLFLSLTARLNIAPTSFGAKKAYLENKEAYLNRKEANINPLNHKKKFFLGTGVFASVAVVVMLVLQLTLGAMFNYNTTIRNNSNVTIVTYNEYFTSEDEVLEFFDKDLDIEVNYVDMDTYEDNNVTKYKVYVECNESIVDVEEDLTNKIIANIGENEESYEKYELYINDINSKATGISLLNALYTSGIALLVIGVYLAIRYRYSYAIAAVISTIFAVAITALFFGLTRIPVGSNAVTALYAIVVYSISTLIVIFSRLKEILGDMKRKYISNEERETSVNKAINVSLPRIIITTIGVTIISAVLLALSSISTYSFYVTLFVGLIASSISAVMVATLVWLLFEKRSDTRKREFKPKKKNSRFKELEESTIIGIND